MLGVGTTVGDQILGSKECLGRKWLDEIIGFVPISMTKGFCDITPRLEVSRKHILSI